MYNKRLYELGYCRFQKKNNKQTKISSVITNKAPVSFLGLLYRCSEKNVCDFSYKCFDEWFTEKKNKENLKKYFHYYIKV